MHETIDTLSWLLGKARAHGATSADAVLFETVDVSRSFRKGIPDSIDRSESKALGLRVFSGNSSAIVSATDLRRDALGELAQRATAMAKLAPADPDSRLAPEALLAREIPNLDLFDGAEPDNAWLESQCRIAEEEALSTPGITNSEGADAGYSRSTVTLAIADDKDVRFAHSYPSSYFSVSVSVLAGVGTGMERDYEFSSTRHRAQLESAESMGKSAAKRALARMNPRKVKTCQVPVIFDPRVSRSMLSALASSISGSAVARGSSFLKDALNTNVFAPDISIIDDPHMVRGLGSRPFDGEGVRNRKRALVENGVLQTWLLDVRSASKLGMETTGHASRGIASPPSPSTTNLYMAAGTQSPQAMIKEIKNGFYVTETFGMGVNTTTGDYSQGASGFWIENGEIAYPVSGITIAGHLREMFASAQPASDLVFRYATNAPTLRIEMMTVAGT